MISVGGNGYSGLLEIGEEQENQQPDDHRQGNALDQATRHFLQYDGGNDNANQNENVKCKI